MSISVGNRGFYAEEIKLRSSLFYAFSFSEHDNGSLRIFHTRRKRRKRRIMKT